MIVAVSDSEGNETVAHTVEKVEFKYNIVSGNSVILHIKSGIKLILDDEVCEAISVEL